MLFIPPHSTRCSNLWGQLECTVGMFPDPSYQCKGLVPRPNMVHSHIPAAVPAAATNEDEHCNQYCCSPNPNHYGNLVRAGGRGSVVHGACTDGACVHGEYRAKSVYRLLDTHNFVYIGAHPNMFLNIVQWRRHPAPKPLIAQLSATAT